MPAMVISTEASRVDNCMLLDILTSEVALEEPEIERTDPNIQTDNNGTDDKLHFGMFRGSGDYKDEDDENDERNDIPTARRGRRPTTELERIDIGTSDVNGSGSEDGDDADADADEEDEASQTEDGSTQNEGD